MSETPIGDQVAEEIMPAVDTPETSEQEVVVMESPYAIPGEEPEGWEPNMADDSDPPNDPDAADATELDDLIEPTDNSGEKLAEADDVPQGVDDVVDDGPDDDPDGE